MEYHNFFFYTGTTNPNTIRWALSFKYRSDNNLYVSIYECVGEYYWTLTSNTGNAQYVELLVFIYDGFINISGDVWGTCVSFQCDDSTWFEIDEVNFYSAPNIN